MKEIFCTLAEHEGSQVVITRWLKAIGDEVRLHEPLCEVSTDKATIEIASPAEGVLAEITKRENEHAGAGEVLGAIQERSLNTAIEVEILNSSQSSFVSGETRLTPAVRRKLREQGLNPEALQGSGSGGRILLRDIPTDPYLSRDSRPPENFVPHSPMRLAIAARVRESLMERAPHVTAVFEIDMGNIIAHLGHYRDTTGPGAPPRTLTAYFIKAASAALSEVPEVNSRWHEEGVEIFEEHHIGIVMNLEAGGLLVPVVHSVERKSLAEVAYELEAIRNRERPSSVSPSGGEARPGTFTISNFGTMGGLFTTPVVIFQPQSAILGIGKIEHRLRPMEGALQGVVPTSSDFRVRPVLHASLTIDHRVLDGSHTTRFMKKFEKALQVPEEWD